MFFRFINRFQAFNVLLFSFLFLFAHSNASALKGSDLMKNSLKYSDCTEFCENIICQPIKECNDGVILKNGTYCKCCEACVKFLDIGENCTELIRGSLSLTLGFQSTCKTGSSCVNAKCQLNMYKKSCLQDRDIKKEHHKTGHYGTEIWIPQCDEEGYYIAKQKKITKSVCVNKSGVKIFGSADDLLENTCACSRFMQNKFEEAPILFNVNRQEHCSSSGSFNVLQCINNLCYCADENTGDVRSQVVRLDSLHNLACFDSKIHQKNYAKDCEIQFQRTGKLAYEFWKKDVKIHAIDEVKCDPDGSFKPKQCLPDACVCADKKGIGIKSYKVDLTKDLTRDMTCTCARDVIAAALMPFSCEPNGNYQSFMCFNSECVCIDEDGESISEEFINIESEKEYCDQLIKNLQEYPTNHIASLADSDDYNYNSGDSEYNSQ